MTLVYAVPFLVYGVVLVRWVIPLTRFLTSNPSTSGTGLDRPARLLAGCLVAFTVSWTLLVLAYRPWLKLLRFLYFHSFH